MDNLDSSPNSPGLSARHQPPQVNRPILPNLQSANILPQIARYTCESPPADMLLGAGYAQNTYCHNAHYSVYFGQAM